MGGGGPLCRRIAAAGSAEIDRSDGGATGRGRTKSATIRHRQSVERRSAVNHAGIRHGASLPLVAARGRAALLQSHIAQEAAVLSGGIPHQYAHPERVGGRKNGLLQPHDFTWINSLQGFMA